MYKGVKWLRLVPDRPGRGGWKTGVHTFQQEPVNDIRTLQGGHVYRGAWRKDFDPIAYPPVPPQSIDPNSITPLAVHGYVYPSLTDPSAQPSVTVLVQSADTGGISKVWDQAAGAARVTRPGTNQRGVFQDINGRCFFGEGAAEGLIMDDRTPAIHAQKNQPLGIGTPQQSMGPVTVGAGYIPHFLASTIPNVVPYGTAYMHTASYYLNHPDPNNMLGTILATDTVTVGILDPNMTSIYSVFMAGVAGVSPAVDAVTSNTTPFTAPGTSITVNSGTSLVTLTGGVWPGLNKYAGLSINFNGYSFVILGHGPDPTGFDINGNAFNASNIQLLLLGEYEGPTYTGPYTITGCQVTFTGAWIFAGNSVAVANTASGATPPGFAFGYSQSTASDLTQVAVQAIQASGTFRNLGNISVGPISGSSVQSVTDGNMPNFAFTVNSASAKFSPADVGKQMIVDRCGSLLGAPGNPGTMLVAPIASFVTSNQVTLTLRNECGFIANSRRVWWGNGFSGVTDAAMVGGTVDLTSASNPWTAADVGKTILVDGAAAGGFLLVTTIATFVSVGHVKLAATNASGGNITAQQAWWFGAAFGSYPGPTYAYAWYDPETGHCSNISPMYQIPAPTGGTGYQNFINITPVFPIDPGSISYPTGADAIRFSHILFFRTLSTPGASTLYPIGSLQPFVGKVHPGSASTRGSWSPSPFHGWQGVPNNYLAEPIGGVNTNIAPNYWYDFSSDEDLLVAGGFRAPQETNEKPMVLLRGGSTQPGKPYAIAYWDGRTWIVNTQDPAVIQFSCDYAQCPLGLPEESFPPTNVLTLPSIDGRVIGMRTVGDMLLVTTERWAYIIVGNNESNYRLMKASSSMPGVGTYQMDEFPTYTGAEGEPTTLFYLGRDRIVYQWTMGGPTTPISGPIQDQLDNYLSVYPQLSIYNDSLVHCVSAWGRRLVVVAPKTINANNAGLPTFIYDIDNQVWSLTYRQDGSTGTNFAGNAPMCTIYGLNVPVNEVYAIYSNASGGVLTGSWLRDDGLSTGQMTIVTFPMNFDGKKTRKELVAVNIHATAGQAWQGVVTVDEGPQYPFTFGPYPDPLNSIYAPLNAPVDGNLVDAVGEAAQFTASPGPQMPLVGFRFYVYFISLGGTHLPMKLYAIDFGYMDFEEPGEGEV